MNQRIRELITQASGHWNHGDFNMPSSVEFQEQDIEKFARLIVAECIEWCDAHATIDGTAQQVRNSIKNHFGVE